MSAKEGRLANWVNGSTVDIPSVRSATFNKLVERVTYHSYFGTVDNSSCGIL